MFWFENGVLILAALVCIGLNNQFAKIASGTQKSVWETDYGEWCYRLPIYLGGIVFVAIAIGRILNK